ncbi:unnamed protein product, partial [Adineta steineri]
KKPSWMWGWMLHSPTPSRNGRDYRVPDTQSIGTFTALQRGGNPSPMLYSPNENHWILNPFN